MNVTALRCRASSFDKAPIGSSRLLVSSSLRHSMPPRSSRRKRTLNTSKNICTGAVIEKLIPTVDPTSNPRDLNSRDVSSTASCDGSNSDIFSAVISVSGLICLPEAGSKTACAEISSSFCNVTYAPSCRFSVYQLRQSGT